MVTVVGKGNGFVTKKMARPSWPQLCSILLLCLAVSFTQGQDCEEITEDVGCSQFGLNVGSLVFVAPNVPLARAQGTVVTYIGGINFITIPEPCRSLLIRMVCVSYLRPCVNTSTGEAFPIQTCRYQCDWFLAQCNATYNLFQQEIGSGLYFPPNLTLPLTCEEKDQYAQNQPLYPISSTNFTTSDNATMSVSCNNLTNAQLLVPQQCTEGLTYDPEVGGCAFTCPLPALTDSQYNDAKIMQGVLGWLSWVGTVILIFCYAVNPVLRKFPRNMILMTAIAANVAAGAIILPTYAGYDNIWCGGETQYLRPSYDFPTTVNGTRSNDYVITFDEEQLLCESSACTFQGAMLQFGYLSATFWWGLIALNIFLEVYFTNLFKLNNTWQKWGRIVFYHVVGWGVPFLFMVIPAAAERIKFAPGGTYCFVTDEDNQAYQLTFWFIPVGITLLFGFVFFVLSFVKIVVVMIGLRKWKELFRYARLLIFIFLYLFLFCFIFSYNIQLQVDSSTITNGYSDYFRCLTRIKTACTLDSNVSNYNLIMLKGFAISVLGFLLLLIFMSFGVFQFWYLVGKSIVLLVIHKNRSQAEVLLHLFLYERAQTTTLHGTDSSLSKADSGLEMDMQPDEKDNPPEESEDKEESESESSTSSADE